MGSVSSMSTRCTMRPSGPVWWVTRRMPSMLAAISPASCWDRAILTPPPLPRPPAWIWALTTTACAPRSNSLRAANSASSRLVATSPPDPQAQAQLHFLYFLLFYFFFYIQDKEKKKREDEEKKKKKYI